MTPTDPPSSVPTSSEIEEDPRYTLYGRGERLSLLNRLIVDGSLVSVYPDTGSDFLLSALLTVDPEQNLLVFDAGREEAQNRRIERSQRLVFVTEEEGVRIRFRTGSAQLVDFAGAVAFATNVPEAILRLQRREFFRIAPPLNRPILARLQLGEGDDASSADARGVDISCGGIVLVLDGHCASLTVGQILPQVSITLPEVAILHTELEIRNLLYTDRSGRASTRVGCRFVHLTPADGARIQRYINRLEIEMRRHT